MKLHNIITTIAFIALTLFAVSYLIFYTIQPTDWPSNAEEYGVYVLQRMLVLSSWLTTALLVISAYLLHRSNLKLTEANERSHQIAETARRANEISQQFHYDSRRAWCDFNIAEERLAFNLSKIQFTLLAFNYGFSPAINLQFRYSVFQPEHRSAKHIQELGSRIDLDEFNAPWVKIGALYPNSEGYPYDVTAPFIHLQPQDYDLLVIEWSYKPAIGKRTETGRRGFAIMKTDDLQYYVRTAFNIIIEEDE